MGACTVCKWYTVNWKTQNTVTTQNNIILVFRWAKAECVRQQLTPLDPVNLRRVLDDAFDLLCYPRMSLDEFHIVVRRVTLSTETDLTCRRFHSNIMSHLGWIVHFGRGCCYDVLHGKRGQKRVASFWTSGSCW